MVKDRAIDTCWVLSNNSHIIYPFTGPIYLSRSVRLPPSIPWKHQRHSQPRNPDLLSLRLEGISTRRLDILLSPLLDTKCHRIRFRHCIDPTAQFPKILSYSPIINSQIVSDFTWFCRIVQRWFVHCLARGEVQGQGADGCVQELCFEGSHGVVRGGNEVTTYAFDDFEGRFGVAEECVELLGGWDFFAGAHARFDGHGGRELD